MISTFRSLIALRPRRFDVTPIGYRGYPQMVADIASGLITSTFLSANRALAQVQMGTIRIIAAISDGRSKYFPDVPTMAEQGYAEAQVTPWFGIVVPAGTPQPIVNRISRCSRSRSQTPRSVKNSTSPGARRRARPWRVRQYRQIRHRALGKGRQGRWHSGRLKPCVVNW